MRADHVKTKTGYAVIVSPYNPRPQTEGEAMTRGYRRMEALYQENAVTYIRTDFTPTRKSGKYYYDQEQELEGKI